MDLSEMQHEPTGMSFRQWLDDLDGLPAKEPIGLAEIAEIFNSAFGRYKLDYGSWLDGLKLCVAAIVQRGLRPMLPNYETGKWEWTDRFHGENGEDDPRSVAATAVFSWCAHSDSGGAEHLRFGTRLPETALPEPSAYYP
ncbi:hypothetical protein [Bradyrhizobium sp. SZCCHNPS1003]|uniref:hypothetical protein n=1 Tax=Bradyrhizobium sp. SZCCHNPS1003 TaxID=3057330 RepID=UPI0028E84497|nr:hypothetical protein [Bradyrhizobium sp. SZCCHNPS1003]